MMNRSECSLTILILAAAAGVGEGSCDERAPDETVGASQAAISSGNNATFVSQSVPTSMYAGQVSTATVSMRNSGSTTWKASTNHRLGSQDPTNNTTWGTKRVDLNSILPGETKNFTFSITAPATPGTYVFRWRMVQENIEWFGDLSPSVSVNVRAPIANAAVDEQVVPARMYVGVPVAVTITMSNTGERTWTAGANYRLGARSPQDNQNWGTSRVDLSPSDRIGPGQTKTFSFNAVPPSTPGTYDFEWQMLQEGVEWFGTITSKVKVVVTLPPGVDTGPAATTPSVARARPVPIDFDMNGNGHAETWDGRIFFTTKATSSGAPVGWSVVTLRPENIGVDAGGVPSFNSALSPEYVIETNDDPVQSTGIVGHNALALAPWPGTAENPFRASASGAPSAAGPYECYDLAVYTERNDTNATNLLGRRHAKVVVQNPRTPSARVASAWFLEPLTEITTTSGQTIGGIEPTITFDGRLIVYNCSGNCNCSGPGPCSGKLYYTFNANPADLHGWSAGQPIANMNRVNAGTRLAIAGTSVTRRFDELFPIAKSQLCAADGHTYDKDENINGAYPWISLDGTELFYEAAIAADGARRAATSVIGRWTNWTARHIDGPINPNRAKTSRLFFSSPGATPSFWSPWRDVRQTIVPYTSRRPVFPLIGSNTGDYNEVSFEVGADGDYVVALDMNELLKKDGSGFDLTLTPDTSGRFNNGVLEGASFPTEYEQIDEPGLPAGAASILRGASGQALYFRDADRVRVPLSASLNELGSGMTAELFVRRLVNFGDGNDSTNFYRFVANQPGSWNIIVEEDGRIQATVYTASGQRRSGPVGLALPVNKWVHVAFTYDAASGTFIVYEDGDQVYRSVWGGAAISPSGQPLLIGPAGGGNPSPFVSPSLAVFRLDEVRVSRVVRSRADILRSAYREIPGTPAAPIALPLGLNAGDLRIAVGQEPTSDRRELGATLFFDPRLSSDGTTSCATCHDPQRLFTDGRAKARGLGGVTLTRNTPTIFNRALSTAQFLDGRAFSLEDQSLAPLQNPAEMGIGVNGAVSLLTSLPGYPRLFQNAFGAGPSADTIGRAFAAFQRSMLSGDSAFDRGTFSAQAAQGFLLFKTKARCIACHNGSNFTDEAFHENRLTLDGDAGRKNVTGRFRDQHAFKTPSLRNVADTPPYFHDGSAATLEAVVDLYSNGGPASPNGGTTMDADFEMRPLDLSTDEKAALVAFLRSLSGNQATITPPPLP